MNPMAAHKPPIVLSSAPAGDSASIIASLEARLMEERRGRLKAEAEVGRLRHENSSVCKERDGYRDRLKFVKAERDALLNLVHGAKNERFVPNDGAGPEENSLFSDDDEPSSEVEPSPEVEPSSDTDKARPEASKRKAVSQKPKRTRRRLQAGFPPHLERDMAVLEPEEDVSGMKRIGFVDKETLHVVHLKVIVKVLRRYKYARSETTDGNGERSDEDDGPSPIVIAPSPPRLSEKCMAEPSLLAHVTAAKYLDHLPLYRQRKQFLRQQLPISSSTLGDWIGLVAFHLGALYDALKKEALQSGYLCVDETTIAVQDRSKVGAHHRGYFWVHRAPELGLVWMEYRKGRDQQGLIHSLQTFGGHIQCDGLAAYNALGRNPNIVLHGCWAHARRYFVRAQQSYSERAEHVLTRIQQLYMIERRLREASCTPEERYQARQKEAVPILKDLKAWLQAHFGTPRSVWGKAVGYTLNQWDKLFRYTRFGRVEIDNNLVENSIRPLALGRKNYMHAGSHDAAQRAAVIYSLLATCNLQGIADPQDWLEDVLTRMPAHTADIRELLPQQWTERPSSATSQALLPAMQACA